VPLAAPLADFVTLVEGSCSFSLSLSLSLYLFLSFFLSFFLSLSANGRKCIWFCISVPPRNDLTSKLRVCARARAHEHRVRTGKQRGRRGSVQCAVCKCNASSSAARDNVAEESSVETRARAREQSSRSSWTSVE